MTAQQMDKVKEGEKKGAAAIYAHGPLELAPCPGGPDPAGPPFRLPERGCGAGTPRAGSAEERGGGLGVGPGAAVGHAQWLERLPEKKPLYTQSRTACRASRRGCAASGSRSPATTPPSRSQRSRSGTRVSASTSPTSTSGTVCQFVLACLGIQFMLVV